MNANGSEWEFKFKSWEENQSNPTFKFLRIDVESQKIIFEEILGGRRVYLKYPVSKEDIFYPEGPKWTEELMMFCLDNYPSYEKVLDKMNNILLDLNNKNPNKNENAYTKSKKKSDKMKDSSDDDDDDEEESGDSDTSTDVSLSSSGVFEIGGIHFAMGDNELEELKEHVKEAVDLLGEGKIMIEEDVASVIFIFDPKDAFKEEYATSLGISIEEPIRIMLSYERKGKVEVKVSQQGRNNNYGIKYFLREIIEDYLNDFKEKKKRSGMSLTLDNIFSEINPPKDENDLEQLIIKESKVEKKAEPPKPVNEPVVISKENVYTVVNMGFSIGSAVYALFEAKNFTDGAVNLLLSNVEKYSPPHQIDIHASELENMGFDLIDVYISLRETKSFEKSLEILMNEPNQKTKKTKKVKKEIKLPRNTPEYLTEWVKSRGDSILNNTYICLYFWLRMRLRFHHTRCIICSGVHKCNPSVGSKPVVCSKGLCVFAWEERKLGELQDTKLCPFLDCEHSVFDPEKFKHLNQALCSQNNKFGVELNFLIEMAQHKYLPYESLLDFISVGAKQNNMQVKKITNVLNPPLCARFERKLDEIKKLRGKEVTKYELVYHGTSSTNITSILKNGLLVPGKNYIIDGKPLCIGHATDTGWYGKGIYTSPNAGVSLGYCRSGGMLLICSIIMGKKYQCPGCITGQPLKEGYDSHTDPQGNAEWIVFHEAQILPCYLVEFGA
eukprot:TRINITY_DN12618_c0_g1_i1.p1 TRINITY_DN12618_c0_g1~~TRINITY_DN12618_c0_g1_i1.p1  ORF type:complete len:735 (-),score=221.33 TRINITY_DN12618_c0_g1_i1:60-2231(-)